MTLILPLVRTTRSTLKLVKLAVRLKVVSREDDIDIILNANHHYCIVRVQGDNTSIPLGRSFQMAAKAIATLPHG